MKIKTLDFPAKRLRSKVIKNYMQAAGYKRAVCFSCGNASRALKEAGVETLDISPTGDLVANRWFNPAEVNKVFTGYFDATSGHLPLHLMIDIADEFKKHIGALENEDYLIATGSGETIICLQIAYPHINFKAMYNLNAATEYSEFAPLNSAVSALFDTMGL